MTAKVVLADVNDGVQVVWVEGENATIQKLAQDPKGYAIRTSSDRPKTVEGAFVTEGDPVPLDPQSEEHQKLMDLVQKLMAGKGVAYQRGVSKEGLAWQVTESRRSGVEGTMLFGVIPGIKITLGDGGESISKPDFNGEDLKFLLPCLPTGCKSQQR